MANESEENAGDLEGDAGHGMPVAAIGAAALGALLGAIAWAAALHFLDSESAFLALGVGLLVGFLTTKAGGRGVPMGVLCAVLVLASITAGKFVAAGILKKDLESSVAVTAEAYRVHVKDSAAWAALPKPVPDEALIQYMIDYDFTTAQDPLAVTEEEAAFFLELNAPALEDFSANPQAEDVWRAEMTEEISKEIFGDLSLFELVKSNLGRLDVIFALLGIGAAFGWVSQS